MLTAVELVFDMGYDEKIKQVEIKYCDTLWFCITCINRQDSFGLDTGFICHVITFAITYNQ
jgi:hypothetical protein